MFRALLLLNLCIVITTLACAQSRPKKQITVITSAELFSHASSKARARQQNDQDGVASVTYAQLFREGEARFTNVDADTARQLPELPTGYSAFKNLAFKLESKAVVSGSNIVVFNVPSAATKDEFDGLRVLHLERDELSPSGVSWVDCTLLPGRWREEYYPLIPQENFNKLLPDFPNKQISAVVDEFGIFLITSVKSAEPSPSSSPFTEIGLAAQTSPERISAGGEVTYTFTITNKGERQAEYVGFVFNLGQDMDLTSATSPQGGCRESDQSTGKVICFLKPMQPGDKAVVEVKAKLRDNKLWPQGRESVDTATVLIKEHAADLVSTFVRANAKTIILPRG